MASFITAGNATNGLQVSSDNTGILELKTGTGSGTTAVTVNASQVVTAASNMIVNGNVGIGTSSPATGGGGGSPKTLEVYNATGVVPWGQLVLSTGVAGTTNDVIGGIEFANRGVSGADKRGASIYAFKSSTSSVNADTYLQFSVNSGGTLTERARITSGGEFLVGATSAGGFGLTIYPPLAGNAGTSYLQFNRANTASAGTALQFQNNGTIVGSITHGNTSTAYNTSSDYRLKHDIQPMSGALAKIAALKPCIYKWNADDSDGEGFIAHELAEVCPGAVTGEKDAINEDGSIKPQGIDTSFLVATLTAAIQEQQQMIETLQAKVAALEAK